MKKGRFLLLVATLVASVMTARAQCEPYTLVAPDCVSLSVGMGYSINSEVGDYDFNQDYVTYDFSLGKYFNKTTGITADLTFSNSVTGDEKTRLFSIGMELNTRLTDYYANSAMDAVLNLGFSYGRFKFADDWIDSEGMDYVVPKASIDIIFNVCPDKSCQFVIEPSYRYFIQTQTKYYYDDYTEVRGNIGLFGITGKLRFNF